jgi:hypothetical protein
MLNVTAAAQAVWRAHEQVLGDECVLTKTDMKALAAALRAAADHLTPYSVSEMEGAALARNKLLAIAAELEAH